jgi:excinuclease ABC subunit C
MKNLAEKIKDFPDSPGVYTMKDAQASVVYVGKTTSLKERVRSYFAKNLPIKTDVQMKDVADIEFIECESELEALVLESRLIKKYSPKYNIKEKDDKSRAYIYITDEPFGRVKIIRETDLALERIVKKNLFGPFGSAKIVGEALELIRKIIPFRSCSKMPKKKCLYGHIGLCPAPCESRISPEEYKTLIGEVKDFLTGRKKKVLSRLKSELVQYSKLLEYEQAANVRDRIFALEHLKRVYMTSDNIISIYDRIEGYDISNVSGEFATGSMVVFTGGVSEKSEYRKFKIKSVEGVNDVAMLKEVLRRRLKNSWPKPDLIVVDGGRSQVNAALSVLRSLSIDNIALIGIAKGPDRKKDEIISAQIFPRSEIALIKQVRDEAHRFARGYYRKLHRKNLAK